MIFEKTTVRWPGEQGWPLPSTEIKPGTGWTQQQTFFPAAGASTKISIFTYGMDYGIDQVSVVKC